MITYEGEDFEDRVCHFFEATKTVFSRLYILFDSYIWPHISKYKHNSINGHNQDVFNEFDNEQLNNNLKKLDDYSIQQFKTYQEISEMVAGREDDLDYSGLTIYLGKIVENELHLSIGQMVRWAMGIDMPDYFNRYCEKKGNLSVKVRDRKVYLNKTKRNSDIQIGEPSGTIITAYTTMINDPESVDSQPNYERLVQVDDELISFIKTYVSKYRNQAAHIDPDSKNTYIGAKEQFKTFLSKYVNPLYEIRIDLSKTK